MPNLNAIDNIGDKAELELQALLSSSVQQALDEIEKGLDPNIRTLYYQETRKVILDSMISGTLLGLQGNYIIIDTPSVESYYLNTQYKGSTLSNRLYRDAQRAQRAVESTVKQHIKTRTNWLKLTQDIRKKNILKPDLPQYIQEVRDAFNAHDIRKLKTALKKAERNIARLSNQDGITRSNLKRAYSDVVKAAKAGDPELLEVKLSVAVEKKAINNSSRLARSEISRAYMDAEVRRMNDDPDVIGYRSVLSPAHPRPDVCDFHAEADQFGLGAGVFPKQFGNPVPHHARCICMSEEVLVGEEGGGSGRFSAGRGREYLQDLKKNDPDKLKAIMGTKGSRNLSEWQKAMPSYESPKTLHALPKKFVELKG